MTSLAVVLGLVGFEGAAAAYTERASQPASPQLTIDTTIEGPTVSSAVLVRLRVPLKADHRRRMERLRATPARFSDDYRQALERALAAGRLLTLDQAASIVGASEVLPELDIADGQASLTVRTRRPVLWEERSDGRLVLGSIEVPPGAGLDIWVHARGDALEAASPLPAEDDGERLRWEFGEGSSPSIEIQLEDVTTAPRYGPMTAVAEFLVGGLPFMLLLLLPVLRRGEGDWRLGSTRLRLALAGLALSVGCATFFVVQDIRTSSYDNVGWIMSRNTLYVFLEALAPALGVAVYAALPRGKWIARLVAALVASVGFAAVVARRAHLDIGLDVAGWEGQDAYVVAGALLAASLVVLAFGAVGRWLAEVVPAAASSRWGSSSNRPVRLGMLSLAVLVVVAQFLLVTHDEGSYSTGFASRDPSWAESLASYLESFSIQLANLMRNVVVTLFGIALAMWLWERVGDVELGFESWRDDAVLALLFATAVTGLGGQIDGYPVPLGFALTLIGITVAVYWCARTKRSRLARDPDVKRVASRLLGRAVQLTVVKHRRQATIDALLANDIEDVEHDRRIRDLDARRDELVGSDVLRSVSSDNRARETLTLGLGGDVGARARLIRLVRRGWWILALPAAYSAYALLDGSAAIAVSEGQPFGIAFLVASLADQMAMWPIAAWCFAVAMPVVPGRIGPWKGLAAGLLCSLPPVLVSPLLDDSLDLGQWIFLSAELTLMFVAVGAVLDYRSVRGIGGDLRQLGELYSITSVRSGVAYLAPLALLLFSVVQGLATGSGASALEELVSNASSLVPSGR